MMELYLHDGDDWYQVKVKSGNLDDLWMARLKPDEKAKLLDRIATEDLKVKKIAYIRKGH
jgi:hypothetical protein